MKSNLITFAEDRMVFAADSHVGLVRRSNQDRFYCDPERGIFVVIDGVGGHSAGEQAAEIALREIRTRLERLTGRVEDRVRESITLANNEIYLQAQANPEWAGMACVLTLVIVENDVTTLGHVGDTRLYELSENKIEKLTQDHSPIGEREDAGLITEAEAMRHPQRNEIYRDIGTEEHQPDDPDFIQIIQRPFMNDCALLLCSDGLSDMLTSAQIHSIARKYSSEPSEVVRQLIEGANLAGGKDNITVIYITHEQKVISRTNKVADFPDTPTVEVVDEFINNDDISEPESQEITLPKPHAKLPLEKWLLLASVFLLTVAIFLQVLFWYTGKREKDSLDAGAVRRTRTLVVDVQEPNAFHSISAALAQANSGDIIDVMPGEYIETISLKDGVTLVSRELRKAVIHAPASADNSETVAVIAIGIRQSRFVGFRIEGNEMHPLDFGVRALGADVEFADNEVKGTRLAGIDIGGPATRTLLRANLVQGNVGAGILIRDDASPILLHNLILGNGQKTGEYGVRVNDTARPQLIGNVLMDNGMAGITSLKAESEEEVNKNNILFSSTSNQTQK